jgi:HSP20 family molecular chaperone IbpA
MNYDSEQTPQSFIVTTRLPELRRGDIEIKVEGRSLRIVGKQSSSQVPIESVIEIPSGYELTRVLATYLKGQLRVVVPKAAA